jgi:2-keto-4-pentenoate hydratase
MAWLANQLARSGLGLKAGQIILAGSLTLPVPVRGGDAVLARFDKLGNVEVRFI